MKNITKLTTILAIILIATLGSCKKATYLKTNTEEILIPAAGANGTIQLESDGGSNEIIGQPGWADIKLDGSVITYNVGANNGESEREDIIIIKNGDLHLSISMNQGLPATQLAPSMSSISFPYTGGTEKVYIQTDGICVKCTATKGLKASYKKGVVTITAEATDGEQTQEGSVTLKADDITTEIHVTVKSRVCQTCGGSGKVVCKKCGGKGYTRCNISSYFHDGCLSCGGGYCEWDCGYYERGRGHKTCPDCGGVKETSMNVNTTGEKCTIASCTGMVKIQGDGVRIRSGASLNASIVGNSKWGKSFPCLGMENNFYKINYKGKVAFVSAEYATHF